MGDRVWLLSVTFTGSPGGVLRVATAAADVDGYVFREGLGAVLVREELPDLQSIGALARVAVSWVLPDVDVAAFEAAGHTLARAPAELALWEEGTSWEARRVLVIGRLSEPTYGEAGEVVKAAIEPNILPERVIPDPAWLGNEETVMPIAFGTPGLYTDEAGESQYVAGVGLAAYIFSYGAITADYAYVWHQGTLPSTRTLEAVFRGVAYIGGAPYTSIVTGNAEADSWAVPNGLALDGVRSLASVLALLHRVAGVPVDATALGVLDQRLGAWMIDGVIDEPTDLMAWVGSVLLPIVPLVAVPGRNGWRYVVIRPAANAIEAVYTIDVDLDPAVSFVGPVEIDDEVRGDLSLGWAWDLSTGEPAQTMTLAGNDDAPPWAGEAACLYDRATVARALGAIREMWGVRRLAYTYLVPTDAAAHLHLGDIVAIEHSALALSGVVGQVWALEWGDDGLLGIEVRVWHRR